MTTSDDVSANPLQPVAADISLQLAALEPSSRRRIIEKFVLAALGSIPWVGGFLSAAASLRTDQPGLQHDSLQTQWLREHELRGSDVRDVSDDYGLLAVQGPRALDRLGIERGRAFTFAMGEIDGVEVMINRTGYTGEEGVELACMADDAVELWDAVLARGVVPCGLGARDTLRLEVCYPLHGNDIGREWDAISSGLGWACALETDFTGAARLRELKEQGPEQKLVPFVMTEKAIPRQAMPIEGGGIVTSGSLSPMLDVGIGLGYVPAEQSKRGTTLVIDVRGRPRSAEVVKKPIYNKE